MHIYSTDGEPLILRHLVNGKDGFVILPTGDDADEIYFQDKETLISWTAKIAELGRKIASVPPEDIQRYDDWLEGDDG